MKNDFALKFFLFALVFALGSIVIFNLTSSNFEGFAPSSAYDKK